MMKYISFLLIIFSILVVSPFVKAEATSKDQAAVAAVSDNQGDLGTCEAIGPWGRTPKR